MPRRLSRCSPVVLAYSIASLCSSGIAHAQAVEDFNPGANQTVWTVAVQPDGKTVFGGVFTGLGGGTGATSRNHIGRLNVDGSVDMSFNSGANADVYAVAVQPDGKILVGGNFTTLGVGAGIMSRSRIGRLNSDGSVDASFNPGANLNVYALVVQPDGKILVGGNFTTLGGGGSGTTTRIAIGRLGANGVPDSFNPGASKTIGAPAVYTMALQTDGKIVVGGYFNGLGGGTGTTGRNYIGRLDAAGTVDSFNPGVSTISGINTVAIQADGKILVGGAFTGLGGGTGATLRANIGRINSDGLVDMGFNPGAESQVLTLGVQADGKILAGGYFQLLGGGGGGSATRKYIGRLDANGLIDPTFNPGAGNVVNALAVQPDGAVVVGGVFLTVGGGTGTGTPRARIARFTNTDAAVQSLALSSGNTVVTWARSGGAPEVSNATFEMSTNGTIYTLLGSGVRVAGGWELGGVPTTQKMYIRARGYYGTGHQNGSGSIVESILSPASSTNGDFDGDGHSDIAVYRPSSGVWYVLGSGSNHTTYVATAWGISTDTPVPGDYDGDAQTDIAIYRPSSGMWWILRSSTSTVFSTTWGISTDTPVPADYDGDGRTDIAIYRPSSGVWWILQSGSNYTTYVSHTFGVSTDMPVPGDYEGDGKADPAVYRPSSGTWWALRSSSNYTIYVGTQFGISTDTPVSADYDGDGMTDIAIFRPSTGQWWVLRSSNSTVYSTQWGVSTDIPVPGDYDGDGQADIAVYRPSSGAWFVQQSGTGTNVIFVFGVSGDQPVLQRP